MIKYRLMIDQEPLSLVFRPDDFNIRKQTTTYLLTNASNLLIDLISRYLLRWME